MKNLKILYVGNFAGPGNPLGECPNADYISASFRELGHYVKTMNESDVLAPDILTELENGYDFILTEEARLKGDYVNDEKTDKDIFLYKFKPIMEKVSIPVVAWMTNIFWGIVRRQDHINYNPIFKADVVFTTDGGHQKEFEAAGVNHINLRQGIYQKEAYLGKSTFPTKAQIGFVGSIYENIWPYRKELIDFLKETYGERFAHFGQRGEVRHEALNNLCATLKIVVGDSVWSPNYWSNRVYEIIGRGGFLVIQDIPGLDQEFEPHKHYVPYKFKDFNNLKKVLDYYLEHDEEREKIRLAGFEYCKKHHTYLHRVKKMLEVLEEKKII